MKTGYTVTLTFPKLNKVYEDMPILADGFNSSEVVGKKGKHATQSCTIHVKGKALIDDLINSDENIQARLYAGSTPYFEGVIKPYTSIEAYNNTLNSVSLEVLDYTELLHKHVFMDPAKMQTPITLKDPDNAVLENEWRNVSTRMLVRELFALTKVTEHVALIGVENIPDFVIKHFAIKSGDLMDDVITKLMYELVCDFRFTPGKCFMFSTANQVGSRKITSFNNKFKITRDESDNDGLEVEYPRYATGSFQIYHESNRWDGAWWESHAGQKKSGYYYEYDMHSTKPTGRTALWNFSELTNAIDNAVPIGVRDVVATSNVSDEKDVSQEVHVDYYDSTGGCVYVTYDGTFDLWCGKGWGFEYSCRALVEYSQPCLINRAIGDKPQKVRLEYIDSVAAATAFTEALAARQKTSGYKFVFTSREKLDPGAFYDIEERYVIGASSTVRILSRSFNPTTGLYSYKAEGAGEVVTSPVEQLPNNMGVAGELTAAHLIRVITERNNYLVEEDDTDILVYVDGILSHKPNISIEWSLGGEVVANGVDNITLRKSDLKIGLNYVSCSIIYEGEVYTDNLGIALSKADNRAIIQYRWGESPVEPPTLGGFWRFQEKPIIDKGNNKIYGDFEGRLWEEQPPEQEEGKPYLWMRLSTDGGATWSYSRLTGVPSIDFSITPDEVSYALSSRGIVTKETQLTVHLTRINTLKPCHWKVRPEDLVVSPSPVAPADYSVTTSPDELIITLPIGFSREVIEVYAAVEGIETTKCFKYVGVCNGAPKGEYWGAGYTLPQLNEMATTPTGEPWYPGDHVVVMIEEQRDGKTVSGPVPYVYQRSTPHWVPVDENTPNYSESMGDALADILKMPDTKLVEAAQYGFFGNLAANAAFIRMLIVEKLKVGENGTGLYVEIGTLPPANKPVYLVKYDTKVLFQVSPKNGNIFFGEPLDDKLEEPKTGFMYDATTEELYSRNKNFCVTATGEVYGSFKQIIQFLPFTFNDSLDATHPAIFSMFVPEGQIEYVKIMIIGQPYRTYSAGTYMGGEAETKRNAFYAQDIDKNFDFSYGTSYVTTDTVGNHSHSYSTAEGIQSSSADIRNNFDWQDNFTGCYDNGHSHGVTFGNYQTGDAGGHSHGVNVPVLQVRETGSYEHTHIVDISHSHTIAMGILEGDVPTNMMLYVDDGLGYSEPISITSGNEVSVIMTPNGWKNLKITSTTLGRIQMQVMLKMKIDTY